MSANVRVLPEHLANKIAAGEVVQRPSSVVKELVENSLDAGALRVTIAVEDGGKSSITVADDGMGMSEEDAVLSLQRHATSKISSVDDLSAISTYGFRGEALPSVASVARLVMKTRRKDAEVGISLESQTDGAPVVTAEGREPGTSVTVANLFYNIPARRKFLRSRSTEFRHIYETVQRFALSRADVAFKFLSEGRVILDVKPSSREQRVIDILGEHEFSGMIPVEERSEALSAEGYVGKPSFGHKSRPQQFLFLNNRYVVSRNLNHAVFSAYEHMMLKNSFPFFLLFLTVDPSRIDVNVHPAKLEVKFEDESAVYRFLHSLVRKSLSGAEYVPTLTVSTSGNNNEATLKFTDRQHFWNPGGGSSPNRMLETTASLLSGEGSETREVARADLPKFDESLVSIHSGPVWQVHRRYILLQIEGGLMLVDQHVAHERVLYEQLVMRFSTGNQPGQQLLFPETFRLGAADASTLQEMIPLFGEIGFLVRPFGGDTFIVESAPPGIRPGSEAEVVVSMLSQRRNSTNNLLPPSRDALAKSFSCKAAVKAGDSLTDQEMRTLVRDLFATRMPFVCPHGRPTVMRLSLEELDRRFGRI